MSNESDRDLLGFAPERIVLGELLGGGGIGVLVTEAGREAAAAAGVPVDCDLCRTTFATGDEFWRVVLGIDDVPDVVGAPPGSHNLVESTSELTVCKGCHPQAEHLVEGLLAALWKLRAPAPVLAGSPSDDELPPTERAL